MKFAIMILMHSHDRAIQQYPVIVEKAMNLIRLVLSHIHSSWETQITL